MSGFSKETAVDVVALAQRGDVAAFKKLYQEYGNAVLRLTCGILGSVEDGKDLTQDIFIKVFNKLPELKQAEAFAGWLKQLSIRMAIDQLRQRQYWVTDDVLESFEAEPDWLQMTTALANYGEDITNLLQGLTETERAMVWLHVVEGYQHTELATLLDCSADAVRQRYRRAMIKLKTTLGESAENEQRTAI
ncbi:MAG: RNA polymerase sigma factor [Pseudomonadota bacterium]